MKTLIAPLNWGLGHATRCVPIIRKLIAEGHEVVVAADGFPLIFLEQAFPQLRYIELPSYSVYYSEGKSQVGAMLFNLPTIITGIIREHFWLRSLLQHERFDQVISDNRFGMWNRKVRSIYITHQLMIKMPTSLRLIEPMAHQIHKAIIRQYDECWIPDQADNGGLSGDLSHFYPLPTNARFIGTLSRFEGMADLQPNTTYDVVAVVSGLEPQRTLFETQLRLRYKNQAENVLIVCGEPQSQNAVKTEGNIQLVHHLADEELAAILMGCKKIICRSGYSSIMDLKALNCLQKAELIPTPGQTEQQYLTEFLASRK